MNMRIGQGVDVHAFGPGDHLVLGGVRIDFDRGVEAHSDGDVALHALCDALLGAAAMGDLGAHFPADDPQYKDASSLDLLAAVVEMLTERGWQAINCDITIVCEAPKIAPHTARMRLAIADRLGIARSAVSVKATTTEKLGLTGRGEGIAAFAVALIEED